MSATAENTPARRSTRRETQPNVASTPSTPQSASGTRPAHSWRPKVLKPSAIDVNGQLRAPEVVQVRERVVRALEREVRGAVEVQRDPAREVGDVELVRIPEARPRERRQDEEEEHRQRERDRERQPARPVRGVRRVALGGFSASGRRLGRLGLLGGSRRRGFARRVAAVRPLRASLSSGCGLSDSAMGDSVRQWRSRACGALGRRAKRPLRRRNYYVCRRISARR